MLEMTEAERTSTYQRPINLVPLSKTKRKRLLQKYFEHYRMISSRDPELLKQELSPAVFRELLDLLGGVLLREASDLAVKPGPVKDFLELNWLPSSLAELLPPEFRVFCLALNALKQWVSAEQQATDRFLLGGNAEDELRTITGSCVVTRRPLEGDCELYHPVRDGRPPIPVCHEAHDWIEKQLNICIIDKIRLNNNNSWKNLRRGCLELIGTKVHHSTAAVGARSRAFARNASKNTGLSFEEIITLLDHYGYGLE